MRGKTIIFHTVTIIIANSFALYTFVSTTLKPSTHTTNRLWFKIIRKSSVNYWLVITYLWQAKWIKVLTVCCKFSCARSTSTLHNIYSFILRCSWYYKCITLPHQHQPTKFLLPIRHYYCVLYAEFSLRISFCHLNWLLKLYLIITLNISN